MRLSAIALLTLSSSLVAQAQFREDLSAVTGPSTRSVFLDIDGDGDQDLLQSSTAELLVQINDGSGAFTPMSLLASPGAQDLAVGDFDGDGDDDAILVGLNPSEFRLIRNDGVGTTSLLPLTGGAVGAGGGGVRVAVADLDGDQDLDFIASPTIGNVTAFLNDGSGFFHADTNAFSPQLILGGIAAAGDFDADGDVDLLLTAQGPRLFLNDGSGTFTPTTALPASLSSGSLSSVGDFNGDGIDDVLVVSGGAITLYAGDPVGLLLEVPTGIPTSVGLSFALATADIDDDGDLDAVIAGFGSFLLLVNDGAGAFTDTGSARLVLSGITNQLAFGDVDGDADPDLYGTGPFGAIVYRNHHREVIVPTMPTIGGTLTLEMSYAPGYGTGLGLALPFVGPEAPARTPSPFGTVWIETGLASALPFVGVVGINGDATLNAPVPNEPGLVGLAFLTQTLIFEPFDPSVSERLTGFRRVIIQ